MCRIYPVSDIFVVCDRYSHFKTWVDRITVMMDLTRTKLHHVDRIEKVLGLEIAPENLVILDPPVRFSLNDLRCRIRKPSWFGETFETRFMWQREKPESQICLFVGGPWDGRKALIEENIDYYHVPELPPIPEYIPNDSSFPATMKITVYVRQRLYEHNKKPFSIFHYEDGEGWLKKLVNGYKPGYGNFEPDIF